INSKLSYEKGYLDEALERLQELVQLDDKNPEYKNFYEKVKTEKAALATRLADIRRLVEQSRFNEAIAPVQAAMGNYNDHTLLEAVSEEAQRKREEARQRDIAALRVRADQEPSLEKKIRALREGLKKYPGEKELDRQLDQALQRQEQIQALLKA